MINPQTCARSWHVRTCRCALLCRQLAVSFGDGAAGEQAIEFGGDCFAEVGGEAAGAEEACGFCGWSSSEVMPSWVLTRSESRRGLLRGAAARA